MSERQAFYFHHLTQEREREREREGGERYIKLNKRYQIREFYRILPERVYGIL
jgi:hypothetical protein